MSAKHVDEINAAIKRRFNVKLGESMYLGHFQTVLSEMIKKLSPEQLQEYERQAEEWNQDGVTEEMKNQ